MPTCAVWANVYGAGCLLTPLCLIWSRSSRIRSERSGHRIATSGDSRDCSDLVCSCISLKISLAISWFSLVTRALYAQKQRCATVKMHWGQLEFQSKA
jgi:hypothetical protein